MSGPLSYMESLPDELIVMIVRHIGITQGILLEGDMTDDYCINSGKGIYSSVLPSFALTSFRFYQICVGELGKPVFAKIKSTTPLVCDICFDVATFRYFSLHFDKIKIKRATRDLLEHMHNDRFIANLLPSSTSDFNYDEVISRSSHVDLMKERLAVVDDQERLINIFATKTNDVDIVEWLCDFGFNDYRLLLSKSNIDITRYVLTLDAKVKEYVNDLIEVAETAEDVRSVTLICEDRGIKVDIDSLEKLISRCYERGLYDVFVEVADMVDLSGIDTMPLFDDDREQDRKKILTELDRSMINIDQNMISQMAKLSWANEVTSAYYKPKYESRVVSSAIEFGNLELLRKMKIKNLSYAINKASRASNWEAYMVLLERNKKKRFTIKLYIETLTSLQKGIMSGKERDRIIDKTKSVIRDSDIKLLEGGQLESFCKSKRCQIVVIDGEKFLAC